MADTEVTLEASPVTMAELDDNCQACTYSFLSGHIEIGAGALPGRRPRALVSVLHTEVVKDTRITD